MHPQQPWFTFRRSTHVSIADLMAMANPQWFDDKSREEFVSKRWSPENPFSNVRPAPHNYGLVGAGVIPNELSQALAFNRSVRPATLHEALMLAAHRENIPWWGDDFVITGTTAREGVKTLCPTLSTRNGHVHLGIHELYRGDLPSHMLVAVAF